jgi:hypothetical protein
LGSGEAGARVASALSDWGIGDEAVA